MDGNVKGCCGSFSRHFFCFLITVLTIQPFIYGSDSKAICALANACEQLTVVCNELSNSHEETCNPNYLPLEPCCYWGTINLYAEYIWWNVYQRGLHYAITGVQNNPPTEGKLISLDSDWDSGFRVGAGILFPSCDAWKITLDWLRFRTDTTDSVRSDGLILRATRGLPAADVDTLDAAFADLDFKLDSIRLAITAPLFTRAHVALNPWIAIRSDYIRESFTIAYEGTGADFSNFRNAIQYTGTGPEIGLEASWYLLPCFSVLGELKGAGLYGHSDIHQVSTDSDGDEDVNFRYRRDRLQTVVGAMLGAQWEGVFFRHVFLCLKLGWETNIWINFDTIYSFVSSAEEGNLVNVANDLYSTGLVFRTSLAF